MKKFTTPLNLLIMIALTHLLPLKTMMKMKHTKSLSSARLSVLLGVK
jgi:hypothetical protein